MTLIKYGSRYFNNDEFSPVRNGWWCKPNSGGLWATPVGAEFGWKEWCEAEEFRLENLKTSFTFKYTGNIVTIDNEEDLQKLIWVPDEKTTYKMFPIVDFETMRSIGVDAIHLTSEGQWKTRLTRPLNLYGWDCECVLIMNPKGIELTRVMEV